MAAPTTGPRYEVLLNSRPMPAPVTTVRMARATVVGIVAIAAERTDSVAGAAVRPAGRDGVGRVPVTAALRRDRPTDGFVRAPRPSRRGTARRGAARWR